LTEFAKLFVFKSSYFIFYKFCSRNEFNESFDEKDNKYQEVTFE